MLASSPITRAAVDFNHRGDRCRIGDAYHEVARPDRERQRPATAGGGPNRTDAAADGVPVDLVDRHRSVPA